MALLKHYKNHTKLADSRVQRVGFRGCFRSRSDFFELRLQSLAICDFEIAAIRVKRFKELSSSIHGFHSCRKEACFHTFTHSHSNHGCNTSPIHSITQRTHAFAVIITNWALLGEGNECTLRLHSLGQF